MNRELRGKWFFCLLVSIVLCCGFLAPAGYAQDAKIKAMTMRIAHGAPTSDPRHLGALEIKKYLETQSKGKMKVDVFPAGQLGEDRDLIEAAQGGGVQIAILPTAFMGGFQPLMTLLDVPYLFPQDPVLARKVIDGPAGDALLKTLDSVRIVGLDFWESAYKHFSANKPLRTLADFKGLKFRVMPSDMLITMIKAFGGSAITFPYSEVYTGLQTGAIDGQEASLTSIYNMKFHEVQKFITRTYHIKSEFLIMGSKVWFDGLNEETRNLVRQAVSEGAKVNLAAKKEEEEKAVTSIQKAGTKIVDLTPDEIQKFREATYPACLSVYLKKNGERGQKHADLVKQEIAKAK
jgi:tripartite ATP-independent transporter DctP family solute receptor